MSYVDELRKKHKGASSLQSLIDETNSYYSQNQKQGIEPSYKDVKSVLPLFMQKEVLNVPTIPMKGASLSESNPVINKGLQDKLFLTNPFPIRQNDSIPMAALKGLGDFTVSLGSAPGELARKAAIQFGSIASGKGVAADLPKNTSFISDILPKGMSNKLQQFEQSHPIIGGIGNMLLETAADPAAYITGNTVLNAFKPKTGIEQAAKNIGKVNFPEPEGKNGIKSLDQKWNEALLKKPSGTNRLEPEFMKMERERAAKVERPDNTSLGQKWLDIQNTFKSPAKPSKGLVIPDHIQALLKSNPKNADSKIIGNNPFIPSGLKERGFSKNVRTDEYMNPKIRTDFTGNPAVYEQLANKDTLAKAQARFNKGYEKALDEWNGSLDTFKADDVPLARLLANEAAQRNDLSTARKIIDDAAEKLTQAGQFSQATRILRQVSDPGAFIISFRKRINKLNQQGQKMFGKKWTDINLTDDELQDIFGNWNKLDDAGKEKLTEGIYNRISNQIPVTKLEQYDSWRRMAMLLNPKTHIRNTIGNVIMMGTRKTSDTIGATLEKAAGVPTGERTKSFGWSRNRAMVETVDKEWNAAKKDLTSISRWDLEDLRLTNMDKQIFKSSALNRLDQLSKNTLNMEDNIFLERAYKDALGQYLSTNKLSEATAKAQEYAKRRALEATFKQANVLSRTIQNLKKSGGIIGKATDIAIPFSLTPSNIVARAVEYSPLGILKALYSKTKGATPTTVIEDLSKGMTGTGIAALGFILGASGWARGKSGTSKNVEGLLSQLGEQPYSLTTPIGSYTLDWAQPVSVPFFMGVAVYEALQKEKPTVADTVVNALSGGADTIFNMTMLQNIKDLLGGAYSSVSESLMSLPADYLSQGMPTLLGQIARTADDTKRSSYNLDPLKQLANTFAQKIPGLSTTLEPSLDIFGREQSRGGPLQQFFSPGYAKGKSLDKATAEVARLFKSTKQTDILPKTAPRSVTVNKKEIQLTPQQVTEFQRNMGQANYADLQKALLTSAYRNAVDGEKAKLIKAIVSENYDDTKDAMFGKEKPKKVKLETLK